MEEPTRYRHCPECNEEFRPDIERCSDCDGPLEDRYEGLSLPDAADEDAPPHPAADPRGLVRLWSAPSSREAQIVARRLGRAGIPFLVTAAGHGAFLVSVSEDALEAARAHVPCTEQPPDAFDAESGYDRCPACEHPGVSGLKECPECGLTLAADEGPASDSD